jgi:hypothetical protein
MHESVEKAYHLLADRDDQEREHAEWLARHAVELENLECDRLLEQCARRREQTDKPAEMIYREFPAARQLPAPEPPPQQALATQAWVADTVVPTIGDETFRAIAEMRAELRKQFAAEIGELRAELELLRSVAKQNGRTKRRA